MGQSSQSRKSNEDLNWHLKGKEDKCTETSNRATVYRKEDQCLIFLCLMGREILGRYNSPWSGTEQDTWQEQIRIDVRRTCCNGDHGLTRVTTDASSNMYELHSKGDKADTNQERSKCIWMEDKEGRLRSTVDWKWLEKKNNN